MVKLFQGYSLINLLTELPLIDSILTKYIPAFKVETSISFKLIPDAVIMKLPLTPIIETE
jgi:hypothetical protein